MKALKKNATVALNVLFIKELEICLLIFQLKRITLKNYGDFYCLNCLHPFRTENQLKSHQKFIKTKDFFGNVIPSQKGCKLINI